MSRMRDRTLPIELFMRSLAENPPLRVTGTAVFMYREPGAAPPALLHNLKHNKALHETVVFLAMVTETAPHVSPDKRSSVTMLGEGVYQIVIRYGFMEDVDIPAVLAGIEVAGLNLRPMEATYFLGRETLVVGAKPTMLAWRSRLFAALSRNERSATSFFKLPPNRVVELGAQIEL
jgi:KUP system potassium uptake protein